MNKFIIIIRLNSIDSALLEQLRNPEGEVLQEWVKSGIMDLAYVSTDLTSAYLIVNSETMEDVQKLVATLPMYAYMTIDIVPLQSH